MCNQLFLQFSMGSFQTIYIRLGHIADEHVAIFIDKID